MQSVAAGLIPPTLPPSVEEAYKKKCIQLKRRMNEVEESNDAFRLRKVRLMRGIRKMRLERAFLLEILGKRMRKNGSGPNGIHGFYDEDSEGSSEGPPTRPPQPLEKPLRSKRSHRRPIPSPPPSLAHLARANASAPGHPISSFPDFQSPISTTNGTSTIRLTSHPNAPPITFSTASNHNNPVANIANNNHINPSHSRPQMPPTTFDEILVAQPRRDRRDMGEVDTEEYRIRHERRYQTSAAGMDEARTRGRERERERDVEGSGASGSAGGFTAVNG
ncbi:hypothetical protein MMC29_002536 [Sticta canariensis]|nr:hypothetical protein [Sticta canariensis]